MTLMQTDREKMTNTIKLPYNTLGLPEVSASIHPEPQLDSDLGGSSLEHGGRIVSDAFSREK